MTEPPKFANVRSEQREVFITTDGKEFFDPVEADKWQMKITITYLVGEFFYNDITEDSIVDGIIERARCFRAALDRIQL